MKKIQQNKHRLLAFVLAFLMVFTMIPSTAYATEVTNPVETVVEASDIIEENEEPAIADEKTSGTEAEIEDDSEVSENEAADITETETAEKPVLEDVVLDETEETDEVIMLAEAVDTSEDPSSYGYDETDAESVTVTITISNDGVPLQGQDGTVLSHLEVSVPYFDLDNYGLADYYRYGTENGSGFYVNDTLIKRPTLLHLYIYMMERYYMGLDADACGTGESCLMEYAEETTVKYMDGEKAYTADGNVFSLSGSATSMYMTKFWGHGENLQYYRNHRYPLMSEGWGATADYILLSNGDDIDLGMFSNWNFYQTGAFLSFDQESYTAKAEESFTVTTRATAQKAGTAEEETPIVTYTDELNVQLYDADWNVVEDAKITNNGDGTYTIKAPSNAGNYFVMASDLNATTEESDKAPATAALTVTMSGYEVTVNVAPTTAEVKFFADKNAVTEVDAARVTDNGIVGYYHQYVLTIPEGTYSYRATDGGQDLGGMSFDVPFDEEILSDGTSSNEGLKLTLVRLNTYTTNTAIKNIGDYSLKIMPGKFADAVCGEQYVDGSNRVVTPTMIVARGNALVYQIAITLHNEPAQDYAVANLNNLTFAASLKATKDQTFSLSAIVEHTITAPKGAKVQMFNQLKNFYAAEIKASSSTKNSDGTVTHTFETPGGANLSYRVSMDGKITRAGYMSRNAENLVITFDKSENPKTTEHKLDNANIQKRMEASTLVNVNSQNELNLGKDDSFRLRMYRAAWEIINSDTANIMIEPDFHYEIISGAEHIQMTPVTDICTGNASNNWVDIKGISEGVAIVEVSYDAIMIGGEGTSYDGLYGATDPQRTSLIVINVGGAENTLSMTANGSTNTWDTEFDTVYFTEDTGSLTFTAKLGEEIAEKVELSTDKGATWTEITGENGTYTANGLIKGNNILKFTKGDTVEYQVVRAAKVTYTMTNLTRGGSAVLPGDQIKIVFHGLFTPISKMSGIYNPGFGKGHKVTYILPEGLTATAAGGQYDFISSNTYTVTLPDTIGEYSLTGGYVAFNVMGSAPGAHRQLTDSGIGANFSASSSDHKRSVFPDITLSVVSMPSIVLSLDITDGETAISDAAIILKDANGTEVAAKEDGTYDVVLGTYKYEIYKDGFIKESGSFDVTLDDKDGKTVVIILRKMDETVWDGKTLTEVIPNEAGIYEISTGSELAWFANLVNTDKESSKWDAVLTADISLGNFPWTPIAGVSNTYYKGTFDGNGHKITDLYIDSTSYNQGLFGTVGSNAGSAVIQYLSVYGTVKSTGRYVGGIASQMNKNAIIQYCANHVDVTGDRNVGGIVGYQGINDTTKVTNCYNTGSITSNKTLSGGISGSNGSSSKIVIENCYSVGTVSGGYALAGTTSATNIKNSYYLSGTGSSKVGTEVSAEALRALADTLGDAFTDDTENINKGYPVFAKRPVYKVTMKVKNATGASEVKHAASYIFSYSNIEEGYDYSPVVAMNGEEISVTDNGNGSWTIANVTGDITISKVEKTLKTFPVTVNGTAKDDVSVSANAVYGKDLTFSIAEEAGFSYTVMVAANEADVLPCVAENGIYTVENVVGPVVITAERTEIEGVKEYTVSFDLNGHGEVLDAQLVKDGALVTVPEEPIAEGFTFAGWYADAECKQAWNFAVNAVHSDVTLYAKWIVSVSEEENAIQIRELADVVYNGKAQKPAVEVYDGDVLLKANKDYTVKYVNNTNVNAELKTGNGMGADFDPELPHVIITGKGNYSEVIYANFNILPVSVADEAGELAAGFKLSVNAQNVAGKKAITIFKSLQYKKTLKNGVDFDAVLYKAADEVKTALDGVKVPAGEVGKYELVITGKGNYTGELTVKDITVAESKNYLIKNATITLGKNIKKTAYAADGVTLQAAMQNGADVFTVKIGKTYLNPETDYEVSYLNNDSVGKATLTITGKGVYSGSKSATFQIVGTVLKASNVSVEGLTNKVYTGKEAVFNGLKLMYQDQEISRDAYTVTYKNNINKGTASVTFTMDPESGYTGKITKKFKIAAASLADSMKSGMSNISTVYSPTGAKVNDKISLVYDGITLTEGKDYTVTYKNHMKAISATAASAPTMILKGKGNFTGTLEQKFTITAKELSHSNITITVEPMAYDASIKKYEPKVTVKDGNKNVKSTEYTVAYASNTRIDYRNGKTGTVTVTGASANYTGTVKNLAINIYTTKITTKNLFVVVNEEESVYTGAQVTPSVEVYYAENSQIIKDLNKSYAKLNALKTLDIIIDMDAYIESAKQEIIDQLTESEELVKLTASTHYKVTYGDNVVSGKNKGAVTITGLKPYGGSVTVKFDISKKTML